MTSESVRAQQQLVAAESMLIPTADPGVALTNFSFESVIEGLRRSLLQLAAPESPVALAVPPVISREFLERVGYVETFPHLLGTVHSFTGSAQRWRELRNGWAAGQAPWHGDQQISDLTLLPATCYHIYPLFAGTSLPESMLLTAESYCYRHELTHERGRLRSFRMREFVRIASPEECVRWRDRWLDRSADWLAGLGLDVSVEPASDPFFGGAARIMSASQLDQELKWELVVPVGNEQSQAVASANCHRQHFGAPLDIRVDEQQAHTACTAFGLERIVLALIAAHGETVATWPETVRGRLALC